MIGFKAYPIAIFSTGDEAARCIKKADLDWIKFINAPMDMDINDISSVRSAIARDWVKKLKPIEL